MAKQQSMWETKLLDEPRLGFVEEHGSKATAAERAEALHREYERTHQPVVVPVKKYDPLDKILNETRIGFDSIVRAAPKTGS